MYAAPTALRCFALSARETNLALLAALLLAYTTGIASEATGSARGWWVAAAHGSAGMLLVLLLPRKKRVVERGLRRRRATRWLSLLMGVLVLATIATGLGSATGVVRGVAGREALWVHVALALLVAPLVVWHAVARRARPLRTDVSRRNLLRAGVFGGAAAGLAFGTNVLVRAADLPGGRRRFTGSHEVASFDPRRMPTTIWLDDTRPDVDLDRWRLAVKGADGDREHTLAELQRDTITWRATLDCTSGWWSEQDWGGRPLAELLPDLGDARSIVVHSRTGYALRFPVEDVGHLLLATHIGGLPLSPGHGAPLRLVAPGRRGFWWVKWVDRVEVQSRPAWLQSPFPLT